MAAKLRCAIYTRKSSEEGLEQDFNSLHAQREACEAYVLSQTGEGWAALPTPYNDGGFSGGSIERPGLKALLDDIAAGKVDIVVVYKVDRLTRSLADFAKIVEQFDARGVSFVSVTQAFNTTSSMGRLTLNVLLSFAQFEREVTGERIRDKIAASKAKGMWMGGIPPLGYDFQDRKLVVNEAEAAIVRRIFSRYVEVDSAYDLVAELEDYGVRSKAWTTRGGKAMGGVPLKRGAIFHILRSRVYLGEIVHKEKVYPGQHAAIIERDLFDAAAARLTAKAVARRGRATRASQCMLTGKLYDGAGSPMSPSFSYGRGRKPYRYYVALDLQVGRSRALPVGALRRVSAPAVEAFVVETMTRMLPGVCVAGEIDAALHRVELKQDETHILVSAGALSSTGDLELALAAVRRRLQTGEGAVVERDANDKIRIVLPSGPVPRGGAVRVLGAPPSRNVVNPSLVDALRRGHEMLESGNCAPTTPKDRVAFAMAPATQHERLIARLAFLAPDLQQKILDGHQPAAVNLGKFLEQRLPLAWADQATWISSPNLPDDRREQSPGQIENSLWPAGNSLSRA